MTLLACEHVIRLQQHSLPKYGNPVFWHQHHHILLGEKALTVRCLLLLLMLIMMCWGKTGLPIGAWMTCWHVAPLGAPPHFSLPALPSTLLERTLVVNIERCAYEREGRGTSLPAPPPLYLSADDKDAFVRIFLLFTGSLRARLKSCDMIGGGGSC